MNKSKLVFVVVVVSLFVLFLIPNIDVLNKTKTNTSNNSNVTTTTYKRNERVVVLNATTTTKKNTSTSNYNSKTTKKYSYTTTVSSRTKRSTTIKNTDSHTTKANKVTTTVSRASKASTTVKNNSKTTTKKVTTTTAVVPKSVNILNETNINLTVGDTYQMNIYITPNSISKNDGTWSSSNSNVAYVDNTGLVYAKASGTATIKYTTSNGLVASRTVKVYYTNIKTKKINKNIYDQNNVSVDLKYIEYGIDNETRIYFETKNNTNSTLAIYVEDTSTNTLGYYINNIFINNTLSNNIIVSSIKPGETKTSYISINDIHLQNLNIKEINNLKFRLAIQNGNFIQLSDEINQNI
jgi:hypothetical protein